MTDIKSTRDRGSFHLSLFFFFLSFLFFSFFGPPPPKEKRQVENEKATATH